MSNRNATRHRPPQPQDEHRRPWLTLVLGVVVIGAAVAFFASRGSQSGRAAATPTAQGQSAAQADAGTSGSPAAQALVIPTPAIPPPKDCPPNAAPQVDNVDKYGFCTPIGWGAYNNNNSLKLTLIMKPLPNSGPPALLPTDFDRIQILIALDTEPPETVPDACKGAPNDSIDGLATRHCTVTLDPTKNPYQAVQAQYWTIDLANDRKFYIQALARDGVSDEDHQAIDTIVHTLNPPAGG